VGSSGIQNYSHVFWFIIWQRRKVKVMEARRT